MNETTTVRLVTYKQESAYVWNERYELNRKGRLVRLQRVLFWLLDKLRARAYDQKCVSYQLVHVDTSKIMDAIIANQRDAMLIWEKQAKYVVMGWEDFRQLHQQSLDRPEMLRFSFSAPMGRGREVLPMGLEVVVVPWVQGFFVLPELKQ